MTRKMIVAGNWKLNNTKAEAKALVEDLKTKVAGIDNVDIVVCPTFTALETVNTLISGSNIKLGAQDCYWEAKGAFTGEISPEMLKDAGCEYCIIGHSERRQYFNETDATVNKKAFALYRAGVKPIICVGETLEQRESGNTEKVIGEQVKGSVKDIPADKMKETVLAYEPVWAIGTGKVATIEQVQQVHEFIRNLLTQIFGKEVSDAVRIQYGGSVKPDNSKEIFALKDVDGGLIGGAALKAGDFTGIVTSVK